MSTAEMVCVRWLDSCILHEQVDRYSLPTPSELETVGWLSKKSDDYIVVSRDYSLDDNSYSWRSNLAIPFEHIKNISYLGHKEI